MTCPSCLLPMGDRYACPHCGETHPDVDANPLQRFRPHAEQAAFLRAPIKAFLGGSRSGELP